ncbi:hypothetical protein MKW92_030970, partial [Papaver armeniacum]
MEAEQNLPFEVGHLAESKSFKDGFRGAWFRCKIKDYRRGIAEPTVALEYYDFPDEKITRMSLYRLNPAEKHTGVKKKHLMLRPSYPQIYHQSQMPDVSAITEVVGIVDRPWKVGDMVDWFKDGCYWSACITNIQNDEIVQVMFPRSPWGEGGSCEAPCKDLRPSLDWTPELGWTVPISKVGMTSEPCVRLILPKSPGRESSGDSLNKQKTGTANMKNGGVDTTTILPRISSTHGDPFKLKITLPQKQITLPQKLKKFDEMHACQQMESKMGSDPGLLIKEKDTLRNDISKLGTDLQLINKVKDTLARLNKEKDKLGGDIEILNNEKSAMQSDICLLCETKTILDSGIVSLNCKKTKLETDSELLNNEKDKLESDTEMRKKA